MREMSQCDQSRIIVAMMVWIWRHSIRQDFRCGSGRRLLVHNISFTLLPSLFISLSLSPCHLTLIAWNQIKSTIDIIAKCEWWIDDNGVVISSVLTHVSLCAVSYSIFLVILNTKHVITLATIERSPMNCKILCIFILHMPTFDNKQNEKKCLNKCNTKIWYIWNSEIWIRIQIQIQIQMRMRR